RVGLRVGRPTLRRCTLRRRALRRRDLRRRLGSRRLGRRGRWILRRGRVPRPIARWFDRRDRRINRGPRGFLRRIWPLGGPLRRRGVGLGRRDHISDLLFFLVVCHIAGRQPIALQGQPDLLIGILEG